MLMRDNEAIDVFFVCYYISRFVLRAVNELKSLVIAEALELAADEECTVQGAALHCLIEMKELLDDSTISVVAVKMF